VKEDDEYRMNPNNNNDYDNSNNNNNSNSNNNKRLLINQIAGYEILFGIILIISLLLPFPISLLAILAVFVLRNAYRRKLMMKRISNMSEVGSVFGSTYANVSSSSNSNSNNSLSLKYYCLSCGAEHKKVLCPKCASNMKKVVFDN
jgi:hypothetical protein